MNKIILLLLLSSFEVAFSEERYMYALPASLSYTYCFTGHAISLKRKSLKQKDPWHIAILFQLIVVSGTGADAMGMFTVKSMAVCLKDSPFAGDAMGIALNVFLEQYA